MNNEFTIAPKLLTVLEKLNIPLHKICTHAPLMTVDEAKKIIVSLDIPESIWVKNLFLKDSKKRVYLVVALATTKIQLKHLSKILSAPELRFADESLLKQHLDVSPGSVTPLALVNDHVHEIIVILDENIFDEKVVAVHPLINTKTVLIASDDLLKFIRYQGNPIIIVNFYTYAHRS